MMCISAMQRLQLPRYANSKDPARGKTPEAHLRAKAMSPPHDLLSPEGAFRFFASSCFSIRGLPCAYSSLRKGKARELHFKNCA
jgi:hypothetical protein